MFKKLAALLLLFMWTSGANAGDKIAHGAMSFTLTEVCAQLSEKRLLCGLGTLALGALKELTDDKFDGKDMIANASGVGINLIVHEF